MDRPAGSHPYAPGVRARRSGRGAGDDGAALVEFALVLPVFLMLVLAMFTGGNAYFTKLTLTSAAREAARAGATLPVEAGTGAWLDRVAGIAERSADGELDAGDAGRVVCVAMVDGATASRRLAAGAAAPTYDAQPCFDDGLGLTEVRVQVQVARTARLDALLWTRTLDLGARGVSRYEVAPS